MQTYQTSEIARSAGIHPNTVRLYEKIGLLPKPRRKPNGYRIYTDLHMDQTLLIRTALEVEVLQNDLRHRVIDILKTSAAGGYEKAVQLAGEYIDQLKNEQRCAEEALVIARYQLCDSQPQKNKVFLTRRQAVMQLQITIDALRNWEMNGLLTVRRKQNGYRIYTDDDLRQLKIIRTLRCANYSLAAILRMLCALSRYPDADMRKEIDTPGEDDEIVSACDRLLSSLHDAEKNARAMQELLETMNQKYNPTL